MASLSKAEFLTNTDSWYNRLSALYNKTDSDGSKIVSATINKPSSVTSATYGSINDFITQLVYLYDNTYYNYANWTSKPTTVTQYSKILETLRTNITTTLTNIEKICANFSRQAQPNSNTSYGETVHSTATNKTTYNSTNTVSTNKTTNSTSSSNSTQSTNTTWTNSATWNNTSTSNKTRITTCSATNPNSTNTTTNSTSGYSPVSSNSTSTTNSTTTNTVNTDKTTNSTYCDTTANTTTNSTQTTYSPDVSYSTGNATTRVEYSVVDGGGTTSFGKIVA